ncbi:Hypothetical protein SRAE_1000158900 [Strongyloides ratti]|uniref:PL48 domain-containing protein n=1 Tax=Strongyloides ratti TaxID=34506 RepID=A0A090L5E5_STRRB|nr:Hypothetical protein SRAE_1000158900 [Strongyloides ratti]CEF63327.1 Hypothetical protein SRAE_1000158900 [Strongyloides ratti]
MSSLQVEIKKIIGFPQLTPGDKFEITIKHDLEIIKSKVKIQGDRTQVWSKSNFIMTYYPKYNIEIKVKELKLFTSKTIDIITIPTIIFYKNLAKFFMLNLNSSGTLKLELKITLNPSTNPTFKFKNNKREMKFFGKNKVISDLTKICPYNYDQSSIFNVNKQQLNFDNSRELINTDNIVKMKYEESYQIFDEHNFELTEISTSNDKTFELLRFVRNYDINGKLILKDSNLRGTYKRFSENYNDW